MVPRRGASPGASRARGWRGDEPREDGDADADGDGDGPWWGAEGADIIRSR